MMATAPRKRVAHRKSRRGCQNCKNRHVKCDEQGPPCANCVARNCSSTCAIPPASTIGQSSSPPELSTGSALPRRNDLVPERTYMLDLELLHHWTSRTYHSLVCVPEDEYYLQVEIPKGGLEHHFILKGMLCCAALEKSLMASDSRSTNYYLRIAIDYYDKANSSYQSGLAEMTAEDSHYQYMFTMLQGILGLATVKFQSAQPSFDVWEFTTNIFKIFFNAANLAAEHWISLRAGPMGPSLASTAHIVETAPSMALGDQYTFYLDHLEPIIDQSFAASTQDPEAELSHRSYRLALSALRLCSGDHVIKNINHFWPAFVFAAGRRYSVALSQRDPIALFILLHWAVLINQLEGDLWWASAVGRPLIVELCQVLEREPSSVSGMREWIEGLRRCKAEIQHPEDIDPDSEREEMLARLSQPVDTDEDIHRATGLWWTV